MQTECSQETFCFVPHFSRRVEAGFTAGQVASDGGALLLREVDGKINLLGRLAGCFIDGRSPRPAGGALAFRDALVSQGLCWDTLRP